MKPRVGPDRFYYPDVMVVCDPDDADPEYETKPCFVVEVLSPATEAVDRREKLLAYQDIPTLRGYLLLDSERVHGEYWSTTDVTRTRGGGWSCPRRGPSGWTAWRPV
jgi:Uma2 family endonuclease